MQVAATDHTLEELEEEEIIVDPIDDIIDFLVRSARISFKNAHVDEAEIRTNDKIHMAKELYSRSPIEFLIQFGKFLAPYHIGYFANKSHNNRRYQDCIEELKIYHSDSSRRKRVRNRRYKALQQLQNETDYFSEKQMMLRNPLLYEQLVGQYMTDDEIRDRDGADNENLNLLTMILDTVDRNDMRELRNEQMLEEGLEAVDINCEAKPKTTPKKSKNKQEDFTTADTKPNLTKKWGEFETPDTKPITQKRWGDFDRPDTIPSFKPEVRKQAIISAPERRLLRDEFYQEMYSSFIEGRDDYDYESVDNNELFDDLKQVSQDAEDRYFDSETNEVENLEEHMQLVEEYSRRNPNNVDVDPLDEFMEHISNKLKN